MSELPKRLVVDTVLFISYLRDDELSDRAEIVINRALTKETFLLASSEMYDDLITAYRTGGYKPNEIREILLDLRAIPHEVVPTTLNIAILAMDLYSRYGGSRRLHYFDAFHVATASTIGEPLITSDKFILENSKNLGIKTIDLKEIN
ncbi:PIN domain-containing protein [Candidatus Bathyarchaeota archaeon]|nr:PIN domain-containing protein [Candidatus Bathyarchaeota archaeon]